MTGTQAIAGVILAGGRSRRMGGRDKALLPLAGRPLLAHAVARLAPQVSAIALNANGDPDRFAAFALPIVADATGDFEGPLAGILAGLAWARAAPSSPVAIVTAAVDTPFFPADLAARLAVAAAGGAGIAIARSRGRLHPVFGCFPTACADDLARFLEEDAGSLRVHDWLARVGFAPVDFSGGDGAADPFFNINTPADLAAAEAALAAGKP